ncbi:MAG: PQQ-binding-like beta-propeller repeat protein [Planctomycetales bacterium]|nr:PQQ-binding-like beta-propeller repeat protein [Planctomycetales bacterium]
MIASAAIDQGVAVVPYGRGEWLTAVRVGANRDVSQGGELWSRRGIGADVPTPAIDNGRVYLLGDKGALACLSLETGETQWEADLPRSRYKYYSSPVIAGDLIYCVREDGGVVVGRGGDAFELLAENDLGEPMFATPIPIREGLLLRGSQHLFYFK